MGEFVEKIDVIEENRMGTMPVNKLLLSMSVPIMISMLIQALYNIVDSMFVAQISENALTAVSLAFPIQNLMIAISTGTGVGVNAYLSKSLGEKKFDNANKAAMNGIFLAFMSFLVFAIFGLFFTNIYYKSQTSINEIIDYGNLYLSIVSIFSCGIFGQIICERLLQATGKTIYSMISQGTGAIVNIILDPILIFGLFGMPKLGVAGAAYATIIGQTVAFIIGIVLNLKKNHEIKINIKGFRPDLKTIKIIYAVGIPSIIMSSITSVMTFALNKILIIYTPTATAVFGIYFKLQSFVYMPILGMNNGIVPIVAYNFGAKNKNRLIKTIKLSIIYAVSIMLVGLVIFQLFSKELLMLFNASSEMINIGVPALKIISISFLFGGFTIIVLTVLQALGHGILSLLIAFARQLIVIIPVAYILGKMFGLNAIWLSFPIAEIVSVILSFIFLKKVMKDTIHRIE